MEMDKRIMGKRARAAGARLERRTREDLTKQGFIVDRWTNNVDLDQKKVIPAKSNRFGIRTAGFPDFIVICSTPIGKSRTVFLVEVKTNGYLDQTEHQKMAFYLNSGYFDAIYIAKKSEKRGEILYSKYQEDKKTDWKPNL